MHSDLPDIPAAGPDPSTPASASTAGLAAPKTPPTSIDRLFSEGSGLLADDVRARIRALDLCAFTGQRPPDDMGILREVAKADREDPMFRGGAPVSETLGSDAPILDIPGVGPCVQNLDGVPFLLASAPEPLLGMLQKEERREALLIELIFAARDLAARTVESIPLPFDPAAPQLSEILRCRECRRAGYVFGAIRHTKKCSAGHVLRLIAALSLAKGPKSARPCPACGATDGAWVTEEKPAAEVDLTALKPNQGASAEVVDGMRMLRTHLCAGEALPAADQSGSRAVSA
jgi:hypothetical protein